MESVARGVYLLGDDGAFEWATAFLRSFLATNPGLPLTLVPYSGRSARLESLVRQLGYDVLEPDPRTGRLDAIGRRLGHNPSHAGMFRKFRGFWGAYEQFLMMDADIVLTGDLRPVFDGLGPGCEVYPALNTFGPFIWKPGYRPEGAPELFGANAGLWASRRDLFSIEQLESLAAEALPHRAQFVDATDQPFFNFCLARAGVPWRAWTDGPPGPRCLWAADRGAVERRHVAVHWAGFALDPLMPRRGLWLRARLLGEGVGAGARYLAGEPFRAVPPGVRRLAAACRQPRALFI